MRPDTKSLQVQGHSVLRPLLSIPSSGHSDPTPRLPAVSTYRYGSTVMTGGRAWTTPVSPGDPWTRAERREDTDRRRGTGRVVREGWTFGSPSLGSTLVVRSPPGLVTGCLVDPPRTQSRSGLLSVPSSTPSVFPTGRWKSSRRGVGCLLLPVVLLHPLSDPPYFPSSPPGPGSKSHSPFPHSVGHTWTDDGDPPPTPPP